MTGRPARPGRHAIVVFADRPDCAWLRLLKPGFRHCFAALLEPRGWMVCDPLLDRIELAFVEPDQELDLPSFYAAQGHTVLAGVTRRPVSRPRLPRPTPLTCVSVAKRLLGIEAASVLTPWQLFRHLTDERSYVLCRLGQPHTGPEPIRRHGLPRRSNSLLTFIPK